MAGGPLWFLNPFLVSLYTATCFCTSACFHQKEAKERKGRGRTKGVFFGDLLWGGKKKRNACRGCFSKERKNVFFFFFSPSIFLLLVPFNWTRFSIGRKHVWLPMIDYTWREISFASVPFTWNELKMHRTNRPWTMQEQCSCCVRVWLREDAGDRKHCLFFFLLLP